MSMYICDCLGYSLRTSELYYVHYVYEIVLVMYYNCIVVLKMSLDIRQIRDGSISSQSPKHYTCF